jgi:hypothetical protein
MHPIAVVLLATTQRASEDLMRFASHRDDPSAG